MTKNTEKKKMWPRKHPKNKIKLSRHLNCGTSGHCDKKKILFGYEAYNSELIAKANPIPTTTATVVNKSQCKINYAVKSFNKKMEKVTVDNACLKEKFTLLEWKLSQS